MKQVHTQYNLRAFLPFIISLHLSIFFGGVVKIKKTYYNIIIIIYIALISPAFQVIKY